MVTKTSCSCVHIQLNETHLEIRSRIGLVNTLHHDNGNEEVGSKIGGDGQFVEGAVAGQAKHFLLEYVSTLDGHQGIGTALER
jgi:hypothetical protein